MVQRSDLPFGQCPCTLSVLEKIIRTDKDVICDLKVETSSTFCSGTDKTKCYTNLLLRVKHPENYHPKGKP